MSRRRVQITFSEEAKRMLEQLQQTSDYRAEVIRDALQFYEWIISRSSQGEPSELKAFRDGRYVAIAYANSGGKQLRETEAKLRRSEEELATAKKQLVDSTQSNSRLAVIVDRLRIELERKERIKLEIEEELSGTRKDLAAARRQLVDATQTSSDLVTTVERLEGELKVREKAKAEIEEDLWRTKRKLANAEINAKNHLELLEKVKRLDAELSRERQNKVVLSEMLEVLSQLRDTLDVSRYPEVYNYLLKQASKEERAEIEHEVQRMKPQVHQLASPLLREGVKKLPGGEAVLQAMEIVQNLKKGMKGDS